MGAMPRVMAYTIAAFAFVAIGLPIFIVVVKASVGLVLVAAVAGIAAYWLVTGTDFAIGRMQDP